MLLRDQIVIQIGEEIDGMVMIRSGDNRQGVCPIKFLQEVWRRIEVGCQVTQTCTCLTEKPPPQKTLNKIYYQYSKNTLQKNNTSSWYSLKNHKNLNNGKFAQYYYNNINNNLSKNNYVFLPKQNNLNNINNIFALSNAQFKNEFKYSQYKAPFSSTKRPLSIKLSTPKHVSNFFNKTFRSDSQKRPLLLNLGSSTLSLDNPTGPNFEIIPNRYGLKISSIYTISENVEKFTPKNSLYPKRNFYITSSSRPLFVRK